jgi:hypothetical protein
MDKELFSRRAPGVLSDEQQTRLMSQVLSLVRAAYGENAQVALAVLKYVEQDGMTGLALYPMGSTQDPEALATAFEMAAESLKNSPVRMLSIETGDPSQQQ